jgi:hypothetical protein
MTTKSQLEHAKLDARRFHEWLIDPKGGRVPAAQGILLSISDEQERQIRSTRDAKPLLNDLREQLLEFHGEIVERLGKKAERKRELWQRTRLYIYVAGHGIAPAAGNGALLFPNCRPSVDYWGDFIDLKQYCSYYEQRYLFREIIVFSDCCREIRASPIAVAPDLGYKGTPPNTPRHALGYAAAFGERAAEPLRPGEDDSNGLGFFTRALLEGLKGKAADADGVVEVGRLAQYIKVRVPELARVSRFDQEPDIVGTLGERIVICKVPIGSKRAVEIVFPDGWTTPVELLRGEEVVAKWPDTEVAPSRTWRLELPDGLYGVLPNQGLQHDGAFRVHREPRRVEF